MYQTALSEAQNLAGQNLSEQQYNINTALTNYQAQMDAAQKAYDEIINERNILRTIYGQMFDDEYNHRAQEIEAWANQVQAETTRYVQDQENARNAAQVAAQNAWTSYLKEKDEAEKQAKLNSVKKNDFIDSYGNIRYTDSKGNQQTSYVEPTTYTDANGTRVNAYVASPEQLAQMMYGGR